MKKLSRNFMFSLLFFAGYLTQVSAEVVYFSNLKAAEFEMGNLLEWTTSSEASSQSFIIEKSTDAVTYIELGTVEAAGNSNEQKTYNYLDVGSTDQKSFYRLKQVDVDGTSSFSQVVLLNKMMTNHFSMVSFNTTEVTDEFVVTYNSSVSGDMQVEVTDETGTSVLHSEFFTASVGVNDLQVDMKNMTEGTYQMVFTLEAEREILTISKVGGDTPSMFSRKPSDKGSRN